MTVESIIDGVIAWLKSRCVAEWSDIKHWWSVRWAAIGVVLLPLMQLVPVFPPEIQALLPLWLRAPIAGAWCLIFIILRVTAQKPKAGGNG